VLFENRLVRPALGPVELRDDGRPIFDADLIHAVFVAVERQHAAVGAHANRAQHAVDCVEHTFRRKPGKRHSAGDAVLRIVSFVVHARIVRRAAVKHERRSDTRGDAPPSVHLRTGRAHELTRIDQVFEEKGFRIQV
jgi:hypothetical protein